MGALAARNIVCHKPCWTGAFLGRLVIYPPLGALANSIGGLAGARILSLIFMLGATILLYLTASRLLDRTAAIIAAALWALSEPAIRLAFATFDPLSVLLTALSAWLIVQAGYRCHRAAFVAAAAAALALANATAYSGIIIDPVVDHLRIPRVVAPHAWAAGIIVHDVARRDMGVFFGLLMTVSRSWTGTHVHCSQPQRLLTTRASCSSSDDSWGILRAVWLTAIGEPSLHLQPKTGRVPRCWYC